MKKSRLILWLLVLLFSITMPHFCYAKESEEVTIDDHSKIEIKNLGKVEKAPLKQGISITSFKNDYGEDGYQFSFILSNSCLDPNVQLLDEHEVDVIGNSEPTREYIKIPHYNNWRFKFDRAAGIPKYYRITFGSNSDRKVCQEIRGTISELEASLGPINSDGSRELLLTNVSSNTLTITKIGKSEDVPVNIKYKTSPILPEKAINSDSRVNIELKPGESIKITIKPIAEICKPEKVEPDKNFMLVVEYEINATGTSSTVKDTYNLNVYFDYSCNWCIENAYASSWGLKGVVGMGVGTIIVNVGLNKFIRWLYPPKTPVPDKVMEQGLQDNDMGRTVETSRYSLSSSSNSNGFSSSSSSLPTPCSSAASSDPSSSPSLSFSFSSSPSNSSTLSSSSTKKEEDFKKNESDAGAASEVKTTNLGIISGSLVALSGGGGEIAIPQPTTSVPSILLEGPSVQRTELTPQPSESHTVLSSSSPPTPASSPSPPPPPPLPPPPRQPSPPLTKAMLTKNKTPSSPSARPKTSEQDFMQELKKRQQKIHMTGSSNGAKHGGTGSPQSPATSPRLVASSVSRSFNPGPQRTANPPPPLSPRTTTTTAASASIPATSPAAEASDSSTKTSSASSPPVPPPQSDKKLDVKDDK